MLQFHVYSEHNVKFDKNSIMTFNWTRMHAFCFIVCLISKLLVNVYGHEKMKYINRQKDQLVRLLNFPPRTYSFKMLINVSW